MEGGYLGSTALCEYSLDNVKVSRDTLCHEDQGQSKVRPQQAKRDAHPGWRQGKEVQTQFSLKQKF